MHFPISRCTIIGLTVAMGQSIMGLTALAQVIPDGTLSTAVTTTGNNFVVNSGDRLGNNLFHSFSQFSVPTGGSAIFNHAPDVQNIFSRVTGGGVSNIDGLVQAGGSANVFLLNPSGLVFGPNAKLNIGGSFLGTTASRMQFADGAAFGTVNPTALLTLSVPIGLQMGSTSGSIQVQGPGHTLVNARPNLQATSYALQPNRLQVSSGNTFALMGNNIQLSGGILTAENGQVALGSVGNGTIQLNTTSPQWEFSYNNVSNFSDVQLKNAALLDATGSAGGSIQLQGKMVQIQNGSLLFIQTQGTQNAGSISVNADVLELSGVLPNHDQSLISSEKTGTGEGADINISVRKYLARDGGLISSAIYQAGGAAGNITINAAESIQISGFSPLNPVKTSGFNTISVTGGGKGGNISIATPDLQVKDGARIFAGVSGGAGGGNIRVVADVVSVTGANLAISGNTVISSSSFFGGDGGSVDIDTGRLFLGASGVVAASTTGNGNAGNLNIRARESIEVDGAGSVLAQRSRITTSAQLFPLSLRQSLGIPGLPTGNGGNLHITTPRLQVRNQGFIAAENAGSGDAGQLKIQTNVIVLDRKGEIRTATQLGQAGSLSLTARETILLRHNSLISAKAGGLGDGGNITIDSPIILGLENSDIIANALKGGGGNIQITTQGILGLKFRPQLTPENDITASSEFGVNGTVQVNTIGVAPNAGVTALPVDIVDPSQQIATGCAQNTGGSFVVTGRGGTASSPSQHLTTDRPWSDVRGLSMDNHQPIQARAIEPQPLLEAGAWRVNGDGQPELIAVGQTNPSGATCVRL